MTDPLPNPDTSKEMSREYPAAPIVAVSAVVLDADGVLLVRRLRPPMAGHWALPGGVVRLGETIAQAIVRELKEEIFLTVEPLLVLDTLEKIQLDAAGRVQYHYVLVVFLCRPLQGVMHASSDVEAARWVPFGELQQEALGLSRQSLQQIEAALDKLKNPQLKP